MKKEDWIRTRAYHIWHARVVLGCHVSDLEDWLDAESEWESFQEHDRRFHRVCDIGGN